MAWIKLAVAFARILAWLTISSEFPVAAISLSETWRMVSTACSWTVSLTLSLDPVLVDREEEKNR